MLFTLGAMALGLLAAGGLGFGAGALVSKPSTNITNEEGSNPQITPSGGTPTDDGGFLGLGGAIGDIVKILGPLLLLSMLGGGGIGGGGGLFGLGRSGGSSSSTAPVIIVEDDE